MYFRQELEEIEDQSLAPYGARSKDCKGREYIAGMADRYAIEEQARLYDPYLKS